MIPRLDRLVRMDPARVRALAAMLVAAVAFHLCAMAAGHPSTFLLILLLLCALAVGIRTDGATESLLFTVLGVDWWLSTDGLSWWSLPAATCLLVVHSAVTLVASGPDTAPVARELVLRWVRRTATVAVGCAVGGAMLLAARSVGVIGSWWIVPLALGVLAVVTVAFAESVRGSE
ncbi:hypothetical protein [Calidifontibacter terrae]